MKKKKKAEEMIESICNARRRSGGAEGVDQCSILLLECCDVNNISKSDAVSAMATIITSVLAQQNDKKTFDLMIKMMQNSFNGTE